MELYFIEIKKTWAKLFWILREVHLPGVFYASLLPVFGFRILLIICRLHQYWWSYVGLPTYWVWWGIEKLNFEIKNDFIVEKVIDKKKIVLITSFMRSGSTFLGEFFNVHKDSFYQFEPLYPKSKDGSPRPTSDSYQTLKAKFDCKFEDMYNTSKPWKSQMLDSNESKGNFVFRYKSRRLCRPPFCSEYRTNEANCRRYCGNVNLTLASTICSDLIPVIKTIRLTQFDILNEFNYDGAYDPKFIFLVRDPRKVYTML